MHTKGKHRFILDLEKGFLVNMFVCFFFITQNKLPKLLCWWSTVLMLLMKPMLGPVWLLVSKLRPA